MKHLYRNTGTFFNIIILGSSLFILCITSWQNASELVKACILALPYMLKRKHTCSHVQVSPSIPSLLTWLPSAVFCAFSFSGQQLNCRVPFVSVYVSMLVINCVPWKLIDALITGSSCSWLLSGVTSATVSGWIWQEILCRDPSGFVLHCKGSRVLFQCVKHASL